MKDDFKTPPIPPEELSRFKEKINQKKCFYPSCNSDNIIKAHSIQENGPLNYLADDIKGQREVFYLDDEFGFDQKTKTMVSKQKVQRVLHHRGIASASTFNGFCEKHDKIFKNTIEDVVFEGNTKQLFFHSYRAYAYFMHKEYELLKMLSDMELGMDEIFNIEGFKRTDIDYEQNDLLNSVQLTLDGLKNMIEGLKSTFSIVGKEAEKLLFGLKLKKDRLDDIIENKYYSKMDYILLKFDGLYPIASSTVIQYIDEINTPSSDGVVNATEFGLTIFPDPTLQSTFFIFASFPENPNWDILKNKLRIMTNDQQLKFVSDLLIDRGYNIYLSPRMIEIMTKNERDDLLRLKTDKTHCDIGIPKIKMNLFDPKFKE